MTARLRTIGVVRSSLTDLASCPKYGDEGAPHAWIDLDERYLPALEGMQVGQWMTVLLWLHKANRNVLVVHPRGNITRPKRGVFNTRSPARPNPIGMHDVQLLEVCGTRLRVAPLEALDGTPVVDIKTNATQRSFGSHGTEPAIPMRKSAIVRRICRAAWQRGLLSGFNGNVSMRIGEHVCLVTCTGSVKNDIQPWEVALVDIDTGARLSGGTPSSETPMHCAIYQAQPAAQAIIHTHPPKLLSLGVRVAVDTLLCLPIYESDQFHMRLGHIPAHAPGTQLLADAAGEAAQQHDAIHMQRHGLVCWASDLRGALALTEEIEHLAAVHLDTLTP